MQVILVDENDVQIGTMEKIEAHQKALLHRAFSVFIFNSKGEMLLQKRADSKYHSPGLWSNACCSHPQPGNDLLYSATKRLKEEMGFETPLEKIFDFIYKASFDNGLTEHEFDHVFIGKYDGPVIPDCMEVGDYSYKTMEEINEALNNYPASYTEWFKIAFPKLEHYLTPLFKVAT
ncbi:isopentenyl-diphosphate Delta-isomerase [Ferruginibacter sp. SUN002]|uniref:isopentenyl-diphosphate Delta-isomerase n=1 Tax=Ferruginibacter sp. SUN002 TaxID=2937789 RepID=UPI003D3615FF